MAGLGHLSERKSLVDEVHGRLVDAMCSGELLPGTILRQERLAEELNVSRQPIIQALGMLRRDGLVEPAGRRGYRVAAVDEALVRHVYDLRAVLDGLAARLAATSKTPDRDDRIHQALADGMQALQAADTSTLVEADIAFHRALYDLSGNPLLPDSSAAVWQQIRRVMHAVLEKAAMRQSVWGEHEAIAQAILANDPDAAEQLAIKHARDAADWLIRWMTRDRAVRFGSIHA